MSGVRLGRLLLLLLAASACRDDGPQEGTLVVELSGTRGGEGAMRLLVAGGPVTAIDGSAYQVGLLSGRDGTRLLVIGAVAPGELVRLRIPDLARAGSYRVLVEEVADGETFGLVDPALYRLTLHPHPRR